MLHLNFKSANKRRLPSTDHCPRDLGALVRAPINSYLVIFASKTAEMQTNATVLLAG